MGLIQVPGQNRLPPASELVERLGFLAEKLDELRGILAVIAYNQDDKKLEVSVADVEALPAGSSLDISFNKLTRSYEFAWVAPSEGASLPADKQVPGGLGGDAES